MSVIGDMPMPADFRYKEIFARGKPRHTKTDDLRIRHPRMDIEKRARIFAPFKALKGFHEAAAAKDELYENRKELNAEDQAELNRQMNLLRQLTADSRLSGDNPLRITVTCFVPCGDPDNDTCGLRGQYQAITGICRKADPEVSRSLFVDDRRIRFRDIYRIESETGIFDETSREY